MAKGKGIKGFGARYGRKVRNNLQRFLVLKNSDQNCPYCNSTKVSRKAAGIWNCKKCQSVFTGKAYKVK